MIYIILPQAFKNVLPPWVNEFIVLLKETSVSGYIALQDLTKGRRHHPEPDLYRLHAADGRGPDLPLRGHAVQLDATANWKENCKNNE